MKAIEPLLKVQVWVISQDQVLLLRTLPARGEFWQPVTGGVEAGESLEEAALRELQEETGISPQSVAPEPLLLRNFQFSFQYEKRGMTFKEHVFFVELAETRQLIHLDAREHQGFRWMSSLEAQAALFFPIHQRMVRLIFEKRR